MCRLENERLGSSKSFLKVWEYRAEKGRGIFLKLYQFFTRTGIADSILTEWPEDKRSHVAKQ